VVSIFLSGVPCKHSSAANGCHGQIDDLEAEEEFHDASNNAPRRLSDAIVVAVHRRSLGASIFFKNYAHFAKSEEEEREAWVPIEEFSEGLGRYSFGESIDFQIHHGVVRSISMIHELTSSCVLTWIFRFTTMVRSISMIYELTIFWVLVMKLSVLLRRN